MDRDLIVLATSPAVPSDSLCVRKDLDDRIKRELAAALLSLHEDPAGAAVLKQFGARRFVETTTRDYEPVLDICRRAGIDLRTHDSRGH